MHINNEDHGDASDNQAHLSSMGALLITLIAGPTATLMAVAATATTWVVLGDSLAESSKIAATGAAGIAMWIMAAVSLTQKLLQIFS